MTRRNKCTPKLELGLWRRHGKLFFTDQIQLQEEINKSGRSEDEIKKRMGYGYHLLLDALAGKGLTRFQAQHVETGILADKTRDIPVTWPPPNHYEEGPF